MQLPKDNVMRGGAVSLVFDETGDCCSRHQVNIVVHTLEHVCYTTTAFKEAVNSLTVAQAIIGAWEELALPWDCVKLVLVDNPGSALTRSMTK